MRNTSSIIDPSTDSRFVQDNSRTNTVLVSGIAKGIFKGALIATLTLAVSAYIYLLPHKDNLAAANTRLTVWSWDYPQDLTFIKSGMADIAYYAGTLYLHEGRLFFQERARYKPLKIASGVLAYPVIRIETEGKAGDISNQDEIIAGISRAVLDMEKRSNSKKIQIDFDARESERDFYIALLKTLQTKLSPDTRLEITALASWCGDDSFIKEGLCDRQIPMLFSMGPEEKVKNKTSKKTEAVLSHIDKARFKTIGLSVNEPQTNQVIKASGLLANSTDLYLFSSTPWTKESWRKLQQELVSK